MTRRNMFELPKVAGQSCSGAGLSGTAAPFSGVADFNEATFSGYAGFDGATFSGFTGFHGATSC
jgi:hypothetical protein